MKFLRALKIPVMILSCITWVVVIAVMILSTRFKIVKVLSGSMIPTLLIDDNVIVKSVDAKDCEEGDIIVYTSPTLGVNIIHRVWFKDSTVIEESDGKRIKTYLITKGDANDEEDDVRLTDNDNIRKVVMMPNKWLNWLADIITKPVTMVVMGLLMAAGALMIGKKNKKEDEQTEGEDAGDSEIEEPTEEQSDNVTEDASDEQICEVDNTRSKEMDENYERRDAWRYGIDMRTDRIDRGCKVAVCVAVASFLIGFSVISICRKARAQKD